MQRQCEGLKSMRTFKTDDKFFNRIWNFSGFVRVTEKLFSRISNHCKTQKPWYCSAGIVLKLGLRLALLWRTTMWLPTRKFTKMEWISHSTESPGKERTGKTTDTKIGRKVGKLKSEQKASNSKRTELQGQAHSKQMTSTSDLHKTLMQTQLKFLLIYAWNLYLSKFLKLSTIQAAQEYTLYLGDPKHVHVETWRKGAETPGLFAYRHDRYFASRNNLRAKC